MKMEQQEGSHMVLKTHVSATYWTSCYKHLPDAKQTYQHTNLESGDANERIPKKKFLHLSDIEIN